VGVMSVAVVSKVSASPSVRTIKKSQVSGASATPQMINVWNGSGVSISFYGVGELVKRVWLDDPSQVVIDTDGCLEGINQNCQQNSGAGLIHLRRIKRVNIPGLPQTEIALLTIITQTKEGTRKAYYFQIEPSNASPEYNEISIIDDQLPTRPRLSPLVENLKTANKIRTGMSVAIARGLLKQSDELYSRLDQLISYLQGGDEVNTAASKATVSSELVNKLIELGQNTQ
jgi:hypothetical protein